LRHREVLDLPTELAGAIGLEPTTRPVKNADRRRETYLDRVQRRSFIEKAAPEVADFLHGLALLPLRPGALAALTVGDYDRRLQVLKVGQDKSGRGRKIKLPAATAKFLDEASKDKLPGAPLLSRGDGKVWSTDAWKWPARAATAADLPLGPTAYTMRQSVISDLVHDGLDLLIVAQISGTSAVMRAPPWTLRGEVAAGALAPWPFGSGRVSKRSRSAASRAFLAPSQGKRTPSAVINKRFRRVTA
jgi:integrase